MWPVSGRFLRTLRYSHTKVTRADLYRHNVPIATDLPVLGGSVDDDMTADVRRRCTLTLPAVKEVLALLPQNPALDGGLWPLGNEVRIRHGIQYNDGTEELVPMGVFGISRPRLSSTGEGERVVSLSGYDRSRAVARNRFIEPYQITQAAFDIPFEIKLLLMDRLPMLTDEDFSLMSSEYNPPPLVFLRDDIPWKDAAVELAKSIGAEVFFDGIGQVVVRPFRNPKNDPISFEYREGAEATILGIDRELDDEQTYNGVIATGQNSDQDVAPPTGQAWDTDPTSPTYFDPAYPERSFYGAVPYFHTSEFYVTNQQCEDAAAGILRDVMGVVETINFTSISNPAHESGDIISLVHSGVNMDDIAVLQSLHFDFAEGTMSGATKRRKLN